MYFFINFKSLYHFFYYCNQKIYASNNFFCSEQFAEKMCSAFKYAPEKFQVRLRA